MEMEANTHVQALERLNRRLEATRRVSEILLHSASLTGSIQDMVMEVQAACGCGTVGVERYDEVSGEMVFEASLGFPNPPAPGTLRIPVDQTLSGTVVLSGKPVVERQALARCEYSHRALRGLGTVTFVGVPMTAEGKVLGCLCIGHPAPLDVDDGLVDWLQSLANYTAEWFRRRGAEKALRRSRELYRTLVENLNDIIYSIDTQGALSYISPAIERITLFRAYEIIGRPFTDFVHPDDQPMLLRRYSEILQGKLGASEYRLLDKDGRILYIRSHSRPVYKNGVLEGVTGLMTDITERKEAERGLRASEQRYRTVIDNIAIGVSLISPDMRVLTLNRQMREWFPGADVYEPPLCYRVFNDPPRDEICDYCPTCKTLRDGKAHEARTKMPLRESIGNFRVVSSPIRDDAGNVIAAIELVEDVTEKLRAEQSRRSLEEQLRQAQKMEAIGTLAGGIAHDFNNILTVVLGYADLLLADAEPDPDDMPELKAIRHAAGRGAELAKQILTFSRRMESAPRPMNLNHAIEQTSRLLFKTIPKMIRIELHLAQDLNMVSADPGQMEQILMNLAVNAKHAMPEGGALAFKTENFFMCEETGGASPAIPEGQYALLTVSDTGHGMTPEVMERIFEPFFSTKKSAEGSGLGLAMVFGIVQNHGGHIRVISKVGAGSTFKIYLPVLEEEDSEEEASSGFRPAFGTETVLLVDDEPFVLNLGGRILTDAGYTVLTACDGNDALQVYGSRRREISLVILDMIMPNMDGEKCLHELRRIDPDVKVLIATGFTVALDRNAALDIGAKALIRKPYHATEFLSAVRRALDAH